MQQAFELTRQNCLATSCVTGTVLTQSVS